MFAKKSSSSRLVVLALLISIAVVTAYSNWGGVSISGSAPSKASPENDKIGPELTSFATIGEQALVVDPALLDTRTGATALNSTGSTPRTYMGDGWTNNTLPGGTGSIQITGFTLYMVHAATVATAYDNITARVQLWNTYTAASSPVFGGAAGPVVTVNLGAATLAASTIYTIGPIDLTATPITLTGGAGTNWGYAQNFQACVGASCTPADNTNLTSLITSYSTGTWPAGAITSGTSPAFGYYRNAAGLTNFNFNSTDLRTLAGLNNQGVAIILNGVAIPSGATATNTTTPSNTSTPTNTATPTGTSTPNSLCDFSNGGSGGDGLNPQANAESGLAAPAGFFWSENQHDTGNTTESNTIIGYGATQGSFRLADNFTISNPCVINTIDLYALQPDATTSPFTGTTLQIWNGRRVNLAARWCLAILLRIV